MSELQKKNSEKDKEVQTCKEEISTLKDEFTQFMELIKNNQQNTASTDSTPEGGDVRKG